GQGDVDVLCGPAAAGRVAVHLRHTVLVEVEGEGVGEPGAAGVATGGVAGPPGDAHRALEVLTVVPQHASDLQQRRVPGGVVADADVPRVVVAVQQDELLGLLGAGDAHHRDLRGVPALLEDGHDLGLGAPARE